MWTVYTVSGGGGHGKCCNGRKGGVVLTAPKLSQVQAEAFLKAAYQIRQEGIGTAAEKKRLAAKITDAEAMVKFYKEATCSSR